MPTRSLCFLPMTYVEPALYQGYAAYIRPAKMVPSSVPWSRKTSRAVSVGHLPHLPFDAIVMQSTQFYTWSSLGTSWVLGGLRQTCLETNDIDISSDVDGTLCFIKKNMKFSFSYPEIFSSWARPTKHHFTFAPNYFTFRPFPGLCWIYLPEAAMLVK